MSYSLADFLQRALVWPDPDDPLGWVNLHWRRQEQKGITGGQAFKTLDEVLGFIRWSQSKGVAHVADLYFCTSLQKDHGDPKQNGRWGALRSVDNAVSSRLLFADVDKYPSKVEAAAAIKSFCEKSGSPYPTALVDSGGGLHAYWILPEPLSKELWLPLASKFDGLLNQFGLKHDNISTDMARILRPPETLNYKRNKDGDPVVLKLLNGNVDIDTWKALHNAPPTPALLRHQPKELVVSTKLYINDAIAKGGPAPKAIGKKNTILSGATLDPTATLQLCPMFKEALATGGKDVSQPVWHQQALAATFFYDGRELFHRLGCNHSGYNRQDTDEMYDRKVRDRERIGLGYPSCSAFEADGAPQCKTCPLRGKIQSPLNAQTAPAVAEIMETALGATDPADERPILPPDGELDSDYRLNDEGFIEFSTRVGKTVKWTRLFYSRILKANPYKEARGNGVGLRVTCTSDLGTEPPVIDIPHAALSSANGAIEALDAGGCLTMRNPSKVTDLMCYFRGRMALETTAMRNVPYGWEYVERKDGGKQGLPIGFAYGGMVYAPNGNSRKTYGGDPELEDTYCVTGLSEPWLDAVKAIQSMRSPAHNAVILSAFAAPLMIFSNQPSTVVMVRGDTGGSKSTASAIACAVWARPRTGVIKPNSSKLGMMRRMGRIRHLPTIWDDIRNSMFEMVKDTLMEITQGGDGLKLDINRKEREQGVWDNMLLTSSNASLAEYLENSSKQDGASLVRCFEFEVPKILQGDPGYLDFNVISPLISALDHNHGHAGREYAQILGDDPVGHQKRYKAVAKEFEKKIKPYQPHERFWQAAAVTILLAAELANKMPSMANLQFDIRALEEFLVETYLAQRDRLAGADVHAEKSQFAKHWLGMFINQYAAQRSEIVWTSDAPAGPGKPEKTSPLWPTGNDARSMKRVSVRWITVARKVRISKVVLDDYLHQQEVSADRVKEGLMKFYRAKLFRGRIAAGLDNVAAQALEMLYEIDVDLGSWMDDNLRLHAVKDVPKDIGREPPGQNPGLSGPHHSPGHTGPKDGSDAS